MTKYKNKESIMAYDNSPWSGTIPAGTHRICTCGESANKPYCDGTHNYSGFKG